MTNFFLIRDYTNAKNWGLITNLDYGNFTNIVSDGNLKNKGDCFVGDYYSKIIYLNENEIDNYAKSPIDYENRMNNFTNLEENLKPKFDDLTYRIVAVR